MSSMYPTQSQLHFHGWFNHFPNVVAVEKNFSLSFEEVLEFRWYETIQYH